MIELEVSTINRRLGIAILSDGQEVPVTTWVNGNGECDPNDAIACVCGPDFDGNWYSVDLSAFESATTH